MIDRFVMTLADAASLSALLSSADTNSIAKLSPAYGERRVQNVNILWCSIDELSQQYIVESVIGVFKMK